MTDNNNKDIDKVTGVETTGHEWDGLKELNNPLPRWWVWVFIICCIWSAWYCVVYPSWPVPGGATVGTLGYTQYGELRESQQEIIDRQSAYLEKFDGSSFDEILNDPELYAFAIAGGASAFKDNCATCHGTGGEGGMGYPNLRDDDWIWGGKLSDIHQTLQYGIRADNIDSRVSQMPAFGKDGLLKDKEINAVVDYVMAWSAHGEEDAHGSDHHGESHGKSHGETDIELGATIFKEQCASCHGPDGKGLEEFGAPNLTDDIWLYGDDRETVFNTVYYARAGMMPAWKDRLDPNTIKQLTVYLYEMSGGQAQVMSDEGAEKSNTEKSSAEESDPVESDPVESEAEDQQTTETMDEEDASTPDSNHDNDAPLESPEHQETDESDVIGTDPEAENGDDQQTGTEEQ